MIPCHYALSPNDSVAHSNGLDSEWFGNRFRIYTESHGIVFIPNESESCIRAHNIFDILHPSQTSLHINNFSHLLISFLLSFHFSSYFISSHFTTSTSFPSLHSPAFLPLSSFFFPFDGSSLQCPVRGFIPFPSIFSRSIFLVSPPPITLLSILCRFFCYPSPN